MVIVLAMSIPTSVLALMYVVFVVARLSWTSKLQAGTDYSIQSAIFRGGATAAVGVGGLLAAWLGWAGFFVAYAAIVVAVCLVFFAVSRSARPAGCPTRETRAVIGANRLAGGCRVVGIEIRFY